MNRHHLLDITSLIPDSNVRRKSRYHLRLPVHWFCCWSVTTTSFVASSRTIIITVKTTSHGCVSVWCRTSHNQIWRPMVKCHLDKHNIMLSTVRPQALVTTSTPAVEIVFLIGHNFISFSANSRILRRCAYPHRISPHVCLGCAPLMQSKFQRACVVSGKLSISDCAHV